jgi:hypothetical protein
LWWSLIIVRAVFKPEGVSDVEFFVAIFGYVAHRFVLGTKYALLTEEYTRALERRSISANVHRNIELVTGWASPSIEVCDRELRSAGRKLGIHLDRVSVILNKGDMMPHEIRTGTVAAGAGTGTGAGTGNGVASTDAVGTSSISDAQAAADPLFGVGLATMDDTKYDPMIAPTPETPGLHRRSQAPTPALAPTPAPIPTPAPAPASTAAPDLTSAATSVVPLDGSSSAAPKVSRKIPAAPHTCEPVVMLGDTTKKTDSKLFSKADEATQDVLTFYADRGQQPHEALRAADGTTDSNQIKMSGLFLATRIVRELCVNTPGAKVTVWWAVVIAVCQMVIPIAVRTGISNGNVFGSYNWSSIYLTLGCAWMTLVFTGILVLFILVGVADYFRRFALMKVLGVMVRHALLCSAGLSLIRFLFI